MSDFLAALRSGPLLADGAMGSYLFKKTGRLSERNHVYESLNLDSPETVREVRLACLRAGARCFATNSFGANAQTLAEYGERRRLEEINRESIRLARWAVEAYQEVAAEVGGFFILGSLGPTSSPLKDLGSLREAYLPQFEALLSAGVDALIFETFSSFSQLR